MASSSLVWPPFLPSPDHGLMNFPLEKCLVSYHEFSDCSSAVAEIPQPALLASWVAQPPCSQYPTLNPQMSITLSCVHLHKFSISVRRDSADCCICITGRGEDRFLIVRCHCDHHKSCNDFILPVFHHMCSTWRIIFPPHSSNISLEQSEAWTLRVEIYPSSEWWRKILHLLPDTGNWFRGR